MELRLNIVLSLLVHAMIITTSFAVIGRGSSSLVPADPLTVSLVSDLPEIKALRSTDQRKQAINSPASTQDTTAGVHYDSIPKVKDKTSPEPARDRSHINASARDYKIEDQNPERPWGPTIGPSGPLHTGGPSSPHSADYQGFSAGITPAGDTVHDHVETQSKSNNTEDVTMTIRRAIQRTLVYPLFAKKRGIEGTVIAEFAINSRGYPEEIRIVKSSGSGVLDAAAKETVMKASPLPAISGSVEIPITFKLQRE